MAPESAPSLPSGDRYSRQALFPPIGRKGQERLCSSSILIVGCGALGSHAAEHLARAGIGRLRLVDRDIVELSNLHRQAGFTESDVREGMPKAEALAAHLREVNSEISLDPRSADFNFKTALGLAEDADLILDGSDNVPTRFLLNDVSLEMEIPWIYCGVVGDTGHVQFFSPEEGPCLRCILREEPPAGELPTCDTAGVLGPAAGAIASFEAAMALRYLSGGGAEIPDLVGRQVRLSVWSLAAVISTCHRDPACPACAGRRLEYLSGASGGEAAILCGRNAVQVRPARPSEALDLAGLASRLRHLGIVEEKRFFLRFRTGEIAMTLFPDGRAIVEGTSDPGRALAFHARYVGG